MATRAQWRKISPDVLMPHPLIRSVMHLYPVAAATQNARAAVPP